MVMMCQRRPPRRWCSRHTARRTIPRAADAGAASGRGRCASRDFMEPLIQSGAKYLTTQCTGTYGYLGTAYVGSCVAPHRPLSLLPSDPRHSRHVFLPCSTECQLVPRPFLTRSGLGRSVAVSCALTTRIGFVRQVEVIDTAHFQRLRDLKQLGCVPD